MSLDVFFSTCAEGLPSSALTPDPLHLLHNNPHADPPSHTHDLSHPTSPSRSQPSPSHDPGSRSDLSLPNTPRGGGPLHVQNSSHSSTLRSSSSFTHVAALLPLARGLHAAPSQRRHICLPIAISARQTNWGRSFYQGQISVDSTHFIFLWLLKIAGLLLHQLSVALALLVSIGINGWDIPPHNSSKQLHLLSLSTVPPIFFLCALPVNWGRAQASSWSMEPPPATPLWDYPSLIPSLREKPSTVTIVLIIVSLVILLVLISCLVRFYIKRGCSSRSPGGAVAPLPEVELA